MHMYTLEGTKGTKFKTHDIVYVFEFEFEFMGH